MANVSLSVKAKKGIKDNSRTLGYINPEATNAQLQSLAIAYNALSSKTYEGGEKIVKININDPDPTPAVKPTPTLTAVRSDKKTDGNTQYYEITITYNGDGEIFYKFTYGSDLVSGPKTTILRSSSTTGQPTTIAVIKGVNNSVSAKFIVYATETDNFASVRVEVTENSWF